MIENPLIQETLVLQFRGRIESKRDTIPLELVHKCFDVFGNTELPQSLRGTKERIKSAFFENPWYKDYDKEKDNILANYEAARKRAVCPDSDSDSENLKIKRAKITQKKKNEAEKNRRRKQQTVELPPVPIVLDEPTQVSAAAEGPDISVCRKIDLPNPIRAMKAASNMKNQKKASVRQENLARLPDQPFIVAKPGEGVSNSDQDFLNNLTKIFASIQHQKPSDQPEVGNGIVTFIRKMQDPSEFQTPQNRILRNMAIIERCGQTYNANFNDNVASKGEIRPRKYEENFLKEAEPSEKKCYNGANCEGMKIPGTRPVINKACPSTEAFISEGIKGERSKPNTSTGYCVMCQRMIMVAYALRIINESPINNGIIVNHYSNDVSTPGEYIAEQCLLPSTTGYRGLTGPIVIHKRCNYRQEERNGVAYWVQDGYLTIQSYTTPNPHDNKRERVFS